MSAPSIVRPGSLPWPALSILAGAIFVSVTSEFLPTGLMPDMARGLGVSESRIGLLVSIFAGVVVLTAAPLTTLTRRVARKKLVILVLLVFAAGNFLSALAPDYQVLMVSRALGGLAHGLFWAVVGAYAAHLVPKAQLSRAIAFTGSGAAAAFVLGVPLGTVLGHLVGWRLAFASIGAVVLALTLLVARFLPAVSHLEVVKTGEIPLPLRRDPTVLGVVLVCAVALVLMTGQNLFSIYIVPYLIQVSGFPPGSIGALLFLYGGAGAVGLLLVGWVGHRFPRAGLAGSMLLGAVVVLMIGVFPQQPWLVIPAVALWGMAFGGAPVLLQTRMLHAVSARLRDVASAYFTTSFNIAIGGGALIGGLLLDGFGLRVLPFVDIAVMAVGICLILVSEVLLKRQAERAGLVYP